VNDHAWHILQGALGLFEQPGIVGKEAAIDEVMAFDPREGIDEIILVETRRRGHRSLDRQGLAFPAGPGPGRLDPRCLVCADQAPMERGQQVSALVLGNGRDVAVIGIREQAAGA